MSAFMIVAALISQNAGFLPPEVETPAEADIVVTGTPEEPDGNHAAPLGSRIKRDTPIFGNGQIATTTGVAGLIPSSGMDPFAGESRRVEHRSCRSRDIALSKDAACVLASVQTKLAADQHGAARAELERLLQRDDLSSEDRYVAWRFGHQIAVAIGDDRDREEAIAALLETGLMPVADRNAALRTLAGQALRRMDDPRAETLLRQVIGEDSADAASRVNLAIIYDRTGRRTEALALVNEAISLTAASGRMIPFSWQQFVDSRRN